MASSSNSDVITSRRWMYNRIDPQTQNVSKDFMEGLKQFMAIATNQQIYKDSGKVLCPCIKCKNEKFVSEANVWKHLYLRGFIPNYFIWYSHGESFAPRGGGAHVNLNDHNPYVPVVRDAFGGSSGPSIYSQDEGDDPNEEASQFFDMLETGRRPLYDGCREGLSQLSLSSQLMKLKIDYNLSKSCIDAVSQMMKGYLPEGNCSAETYYDVKQTMRSLGLLSYRKIDVCQENCMIFWKDDAELQNCRFCGKERFYATRKGKLVPQRRMWYLSITDRLKRMYQSERIAEHMTWHAEHSIREDEMSHPSDGEAWKHFNKVFPDFASEHRNVYLGLCTSGINPFGMSGRNYSLWPVILTPYNLPPDMCMKREFMFLTILVPGPNHPKRSLDVFLQPLIDELKELWSGVQAYDIATHQNFRMRAVLLWTISDFSAYGMLSGWTTHGRLACPYCMDETDAFQLKHERKTSWFDCHRCFLPSDHTLRRNKKNFRRNIVVEKNAPLILTGEEILHGLIALDVPRSIDCGGNGHPKIHGYDETHNWYKRSIFWDLPYWKELKLRHNLDVMHIEKNVFDNIINTVLNVKGKTKDNMNSRFDLQEYCSRKSLHLTADGNAPVPIFRLSADGKKKLFAWLRDEMKFSDGYASNIGRCVDIDGGKLSGLKSHDCHVFMQRLLPIAFAELMDRHAHEVIAGVGIFFRDLCTRNLKRAVTNSLKDNIVLILCNLEKIFPPSFFDVMEHLMIHLPYEASLGGPVQFRWMYPFERFMFHLKKKAKQRAQPEKAIVEQYINEEISYFTSFYFEAHVQTRSRNVERAFDTGIPPTHPDVSGIPDMFCSIGRPGGKEVDVWLSQKDHHIAHSYVLFNCKYLRPFERLFEDHMRESYPRIDATQLQEIKEKNFAIWIKQFVHMGNYPIWLNELVDGPAMKVQTWPIYFTRGYTYHTFDHGKNKSTMNYGICVKGENYCDSAGEPDFHGILKEIIQLQYPGYVGLKIILFRCDWFDPTIGRGTRINKLGIVDIHSSRRYAKYEPFILASQADQVRYLAYPQMRRTNANWLSVMKILPTGRVLDEPDHEVEQIPMQIDVVDQIVSIDSVTIENLTHGDVDDLDITITLHANEEEEFRSNSEEEYENEDEVLSVDVDSS